MKRNNNTIYVYGALILAIVLLFTMGNYVEGFQNVPSVSVGTPTVTPATSAPGMPPPPSGMPPPPSGMMSNQLTSRPPQMSRITASSLGEIKKMVSELSSRLNQLNMLTQPLMV